MPRQKTAEARIPYEREGSAAVMPYDTALRIGKRGMIPEEEAGRFSESGPARKPGVGACFVIRKCGQRYMHISIDSGPCLNDILSKNKGAEALNENKKGILLVSLSSVLYGFESVCAKLGMGNGISPSFLLAVRYTVAALSLMLFLRCREGKLTVPRKGILRILLLGLTSVGGSFFLTLAYQYIPVPVAILIFYTNPVFTGVMEMIAKRKADRANIAAYVISGIGLVLMCRDEMDAGNTAGILLALAAAFVIAVRFRFTEKALEEYSPTTLGMYMFIIQAVVFLGRMPFTHTAFESISAGSWAYVIAISLVFTVGANLLSIIGVKFIGATDTSLIMLIEPVSALVLAWLLLREAITLTQGIGSILILSAIFIPRALRRVKSAGTPAD